MKKQLLFAGLLALVFSACLNDNTESEDTSVLNTNTQLADVAGLQLDLNANPEWQFENLRLYPVYASQATLEGQCTLAGDEIPCPREWILMGSGSQSENNLVASEAPGTMP